MRLTGDTLIGDILDRDESCTEVLLEMGMDCLGCPAARGETLAEACETHQVEEDELLRRLAEHFKQTK